MSQLRLLIVGNPEPIHIGAHLLSAAQQSGIPVDLCDTRAAFSAPWLARQWHWRVRGHLPPRLGAFEKMVLDRCAQFQPTHLLATGSAPLRAATLDTLRAQNIQTLNFLTDDPWNLNQRAYWFLTALPRYDAVFTPRRANLPDLAALGCAHVQFLPFAYNPEVHFPDESAPDPALDCDVLFFGGADDDRVPYVAALLQAGLNVHLYGGYWERYPETRRAARGHADLPTLRRAVKQARVCLNLVRRANRDDHVMRTFEVPAMRGCLLNEDTLTHRELFGETSLYFTRADELVQQAHWLLEHSAERIAMTNAAHTRLVHANHTYRDRLTTLLAFAPAKANV